MKIRSTLSALALLGATSGFALAAPIVTDIQVDADFSAVDSGMASTFWPTIEADLEGELSKRLAPYAGEDGVKINVSIRELAINTSVSEATYSDLNGLDGVVSISGPTEDSITTSFRIHYAVLPPDDPTVMPGVVVLPPGADDTYAALIDAVVDEVEKKLAKHPM